MNVAGIQPGIPVTPTEPMMAYSLSSDLPSFQGMLEFLLSRGLKSGMAGNKNDETTDLNELCLLGVPANGQIFFPTSLANAQSVAAKEAMVEPLALNFVSMEDQGKAPTLLTVESITEAGVNQDSLLAEVAGATVVDRPTITADIPPMTAIADSLPSEKLRLAGEEMVSLHRDAVTSEETKETVASKEMAMGKPMGVQADVQKANETKVDGTKANETKVNETNRQLPEQANLGSDYHLKSTGISPHESMSADNSPEVETSSVISQVVDKIVVGNTGKDTELRMRLHPEELGEVKVKMVFAEDKLTVEISMMTEEAREILQDNLPEIREMIEKSHSGAVEVSVDTASTEQQMDFQRFVFQQNNGNSSPFGTRKGQAVAEATETLEKYSKEITIGLLNRIV